MSTSTDGASARGLLLTWAALMALAALSFALRFAHLGRLGMSWRSGSPPSRPARRLVFMELAFEKPSVRLAFAAGR